MTARFFLLLICLPFTGIAQEPLSPQKKPNPLVANPARDLFDLATLYYNSGEEDKANYRLAAKKFDTFLRSYTDHAKALDAWYFLALSYQKVGEDKAARSCFETVIKRGKGGKYVTGAALQLASQDYEAKNWAAAAKWFDILTRTAREKQVRHEALYRRFLCFNELGDEKSMATALRAVLREPDIQYAESARLSLARLYQKQDKSRKAFPLYAKLATSKDQKISGDATLQAALIAQQVGDKRQAPRWFAAAFRHPALQEWRGQTQLTLMNFAYQAKDWQEVVRYYEKGEFKLKKEPALQRHILAAKSYDALKEQKKALKVYEKIDRLSPDSASGFEAAYRVLVKAYEAERQNFTKKAETFLRSYGKSHATDPKIHSTRLLLAESYYKRQLYQRAIARYRGLNFALIEPENRLGVRYHLARSLLAIKDHPGALKAIATFLQKYPKSQQAPKLRLQRAELLSELGKGNEALADYQSLLTSSPDSKIKSLVLQRLAIIYKDQKDYGRFAKTQQDILKLPQLSQTMKASAKFWLGWNDYRLKNYPSAAKLLREAREISPKNYREEVGPLLIRCAYHQEDLTTLEQEINALRRHDNKAKIPPTIQLWLGATLARKDEFKRAWSLLHRGIQPDSKPVMWRLYTQTALATNHFNDALKASDTLLKIETHPYRKAEAFFWKAKALTKLKKFDGAREATSEALDLRPTGELDISLRLHAGDIEMAAKTPTAALRHYLIVESLYAKTPEDKKLATQKVIQCLKAIGTPKALAKLPKFQAKLR